MHEIGNSETIVVYQEMGPAPTTISVPNIAPAPTPAEPELITVEILPASSGSRSEGKVVYHISVEMAHRIQELLGMLGIQDVVNSCKGYDLYNPKISRIRPTANNNRIEECLRSVETFGSVFQKVVPPHTLQLAPRNYPLTPAPGKAVVYPIPKLVRENFYVVIPMYAAAKAQEQFHVPTLVRSAVALTVIMHAVMYARQIALDISIPISSVSTKITEDVFHCPDEILCVDEACDAQKDDEPIEGRNAYCRAASIRSYNTVPSEADLAKPKNKNCRCTPISYPHHTEVEYGYMEAQYGCLEELLKLSGDIEPKFEPICNKVKSLSKRFREGFLEYDSF
jgi:hypothetical protein